MEESGTLNIFYLPLYREEKNEHLKALELIYVTLIQVFDYMCQYEFKSNVYEVDVVELENLLNERDHHEEHLNEFYLERKKAELYFFVLTTHQCGITTEQVINQFRNKVDAYPVKQLNKLQRYFESLSYQQLANLNEWIINNLRKFLGDDFEFATIHSDESKYDFYGGHTVAIIHWKPKDLWYIVSPNNYINYWDEHTVLKDSLNLPVDENGNAFDRARGVIWGRSYEKLIAKLQSIEGGTWPERERVFK